MSNLSGSQRIEHDQVRAAHSFARSPTNNSRFAAQPVSINKSTRMIKRYIELLHHLQTFYDKLTDQLYGGNSVLRNR